MKSHDNRPTETGSRPNIRLPELDIDPASAPCVTIAYHPDLSRIGQRVLLGGLLFGRDAKIARNFPDFADPGETAGQPLGISRLSRQPLVLCPLDHGGVRLLADQTRTSVKVDRDPVSSSVDLDPRQVDRGVVIELANRVVLLLHRFEDRDPDRTVDLGLIGASSAMERVHNEIRSVAGLDVGVLLRGETGTGKELVAAAIHRTSKRRKSPFVSLNLGAIPPSLAASELFGAAKGAFTGASQAQVGYFRRAHGGTLFLDEIGEAPGDVQVMLLRAIESGEIAMLGTQVVERVDVRIIAATDADLDSKVQDGSFRAPLLHRLGEFEIWLPPLRERRDDIGRLLAHFMRAELERLGDTQTWERNSETLWLPAQVVARLLRYDWPGNVRELRNAAKYLTISSWQRPNVTLGGALLRRLDAAVPQTREPAPTRPPAPTPPPDRDEAVADTAPAPPEQPTHPSTERRLPRDISEDELVEALERHRWDLKAAASTLRVSRTSLYARIESSPNVRIASDLTADTIRTCYRECGGDLDAMVDRLRVSKHALRRRIRDLALD